MVEPGTGHVFAEVAEAGSLAAERLADEVIERWGHGEDDVALLIVDVGAALSARSLRGDGRVTFDVADDPVLTDNVGTWTVEGGEARRSRRSRLPAPAFRSTAM